MKKPLWEPSLELIEKANMTRFIPYIQEKPDLSPIPRAVYFQDFMAPEIDLEIDFVQVQAPLFFHLNKSDHWTA